MLGMYSLVAILLVYLAPEIVRILATEEYYKGIYIMPPIAGGVYFIAVSNLYSDILVYLKKTKDGYGVICHCSRSLMWY